MSLIQSVFVGTSNNLLGAAVAGIGDVNGDGYDDFIIGQPATTFGFYVYSSYSYGTYTTNPFAAVIFGSEDGTPLTTDVASLDPSQGFLLEGLSGDRTGFSVAGVGDMNGDGYDDFLIGAPGADVFGMPTQYTYYYTNSTYSFVGSNGNYAFYYTPSYSFKSYNYTTYSGIPYTNTYTFFYGPYSGFLYTPDNGSYTRNVVSYIPYTVTYTPTLHSVGEAFLVLGSASPAVDSYNRIQLDTSAQVGLSVTGGGSGAAMGVQVSAVGDFNGDGFADFAVASGGYWSGGYNSYSYSYSYFYSSYVPPSVFVFSGAALNGAGYSTYSSYASPVLTILTGQTYGGFASSMDGGGDFQGDGLGDLIVGARNFTALQYVSYSSYSGFYYSSNVGAAHIFFGSYSPPAASGVYNLNGSNGFSFVGEQPYAALGADVASIGDINGDGYDDFLVGSPGFDMARDTPSYVPYTFLYSSYRYSAGGDFARSYIPYTTYSGFTGSYFTYVYTPGNGSYTWFTDVLYGTYTYFNYYDAGAAFVLLGQDGGMPYSQISPSDLTPDLGFMIHNGGSGTGLGSVVGAIGDVNGDGFADFAVADQVRTFGYYYSNFTSYSGGVYQIIVGSYSSVQDRVHVIFGTDAPQTGPVDTRTLDGTNGFTLVLEDPTSGYSYFASSLLALSGTDIDSDGVSDLIVGWPTVASGNGYSYYDNNALTLLIKGGSNDRWAYLDGLDGNRDGIVTQAALNAPIVLGDTGADDLVGTGNDDTFVGLEGDDTLNGAAGDDTAQLNVARDDAVVTELIVGYQIATPDGTSVLIDVENVTFTDGTFLVAELNLPPSIALDGQIAQIDENTDTSGGLKVADVVITDDGYGDNVLALTGADAGLFDLVGTELFIAAGTALDFETKSTYEVTVTIDDTRIGAGIEDSVDYALGILDVNDLPTGSVTLSGTATEDETLTATVAIADEDGLGTVALRWLRDGVVINGASGTTYTLGQADVGSSIEAQAFYTDNGGTAETVTSDGTTTVANVNDAPTGIVTASGNPLQGDTLTAVSTLQDEDGLGIFGYRWLRDGVPIATATAATYVLGADDIGAEISVLVTYVDGEGTPEAVTSAATAPVEPLALNLGGGDGPDTLTGGQANDTINGGDGADSLSGDLGGDTMGGGAGNDLVNGGGGDDSLGGGPDNDTVTGGPGNDTIGGGSGDDTVSGGSGNDIVNGGAGNDSASGGDGDDTMGGSFGDDTVNGGEGNDSLGGGAGADSLDGGPGDDEIGGGEGNDTIAGGEGNDFLAGGGRDDVIDGGVGNDTINGGDGDDTMTGGAGADVFVYNFFKDGDADVIRDWTDGEDLLRLVGVENAPGSGLQGKLDALNIVDVTEGALASYQGHTILFEGASAADFDLDDFIFL